MYLLRRTLPFQVLSFLYACFLLPSTPDFQPCFYVSGLKIYNSVCFLQRICTSCTIGSALDLRLAVAISAAVTTSHCSRCPHRFCPRCRCRCPDCGPDCPPGSNLLWRRRGGSPVWLVVVEDEVCGLRNRRQQPERGVIPHIYINLRGGVLAGNKQRPEDP